MGNVEFTDNRIKVEAALDDAIVAFLYESAGEIESQTKDGPDGMSLKQASKFSKVKKDKAGNIVAVFTYGKKPLRPLQKAFDKTKSKIIKRLGSILNQTFRE